MADYIYVDPDAMENAIGKYQNALNELQDAYDNIDKARQHLDNCYRGPGYMVLSAKLASIYLNVKTADNGLRETILGLQKNRANWIQIERTSTAVIGGADTGTAPTM